MYMDPDDYNGKPRIKRKGIPPDIVHKLMMDTIDHRVSGAVAECEVCHFRFSLKYMVFSSIRNFHQGYACRRCYKTNGLCKA